MACIGLAIALFIADATGALLRSLLIAACIGFAVLNAVTVPLLGRRRFAGRALSLFVNYLGFLAGAALLCQATGVFTGIDTLADNFRDWYWLLVIVLVGYVLAGFRDKPDQPGPFRSLGRRIMLVGLAILAIAVGLLPGILTFASRLLAPVPAALLVSALIFGGFTWMLMGRELSNTFQTTHDQTETLSGLLLVSPVVLGFLTFFAGPLLFSLFVSFNDWDAFGPKVWVGIDNYVRILSLDVDWTSGGVATFKSGYREFLSLGPIAIGARDPLFWTSMRNIVFFSAMAIPAAVAPALLLAILLNRPAPGMKAFRAMYFVPTVAGVVGVTLIWKQLFNSTIGFLNYGLTRAAEIVSILPGIDLSAVETQWLSDADVALFSLVIVFAFQYIGYNAVLFLAGLQGVQGDLYEAAHIDGANAWQRFRHITVPQLAPTTFFVIATTGILSLQLFTESVVLFANFTPPGSGPGNAGLTPVAYLYQEGFQRFSQGYASSVAWVLFLFIFAFTFVQFQRQREQVEKG